MNLNEEQQLVLKTDLPLLVLAGPGSGKTHTMTCKIGEELKKGLNKDNLLVLTFTRKAAQEINNRILKYYNENITYSGTFHSIFYKILSEKISMNLIEPDEDYNIFQNILVEKYNLYDFTKRDINKYFKDEFDIRPYDLYKLYIKSSHYGYLEFFEIINFMLNRLEGKIQSFQLEDIIKKFQDTKLQENGYSFSDILVKTYDMLLTNIEFKSYVQDKFEQIYIDEFQDTNYLQFMILSLISRNMKNICMIGDPQQSIYGFLNARFKNIEDFYNKVKPNVIQLRYNYRSTKNIVESINTVFSYMDNPLKLLNLISKNTHNNKIKLFNNRNHDKNIIKQIQYLCTDGNYNSTSIIMRNNSESKNLEILLKKHKIPYKKISGMSFYERYDIKQIIKMIIFLYDVTNIQAFRGVANEYYGIGTETVEECISQLKKNNKYSINVENVSNLDLNKKRKNKLLSFLNIFERYRELDIPFLTKCKAVEKELDIINKYHKTLNSEIQFEESKNSLIELYNDLKLIFNKNTLIENLKVLKDMIIYNDSKKKNIDNNNCLILTTAHSSKGLEWNNVILYNVSKGIFTYSPLDNFELNHEQIRLLYVAISRAKNNLYLNMKKFSNNGNEQMIDPILKSLSSNIMSSYNE